MEADAAPAAEIRLLHQVAWTRAEETKAVLVFKIKAPLGGRKIRCSWIDAD